MTPTLSAQPGVYLPVTPAQLSPASVGRVKWIPDSKMTGKDNCAWHLFDRPSANDAARFYGRAAA